MIINATLWCMEMEDEISACANVSSSAYNPPLSASSPPSKTPNPATSKAGTPPSEALRLGTEVAIFANSAVYVAAVTSYHG